MSGVANVRTASAKDFYRGRFELIEELDRLRGLIQDAEERGCKCGPAAELSGCPWCDSVTSFEDAGDGLIRGPTLTHAEGCPAFSAKGVVRDGR